MPESNNLNNETLNNMGGKLDTIREILFGQQVVQYDLQFQEVQALLRKQREEMDDKMMSLHGQLVDTLNSLNRDLTYLIEQNKRYTQQQLDRVDYEKTNRKDLGKLLVSLGELLIQDEKTVIQTTPPPPAQLPKADLPSETHIDEENY